MKFKRSILLMVVLFISTIISAKIGHAAEMPVVAIKAAKISKSVSPSAAKNLNTRKLLKEMEASFLATRKFSVVTRTKDSLEDIRKEQKFGESDLSAGDAAEAGQFKSADYLILPEIHHFSFYAKTHKVPHLQSKYFRTDHGSMEVNVQVVDTVTGEIKSTFALKDSFSTKERMVNKSGGIPNKKYFSKMAKNVSAQMADQFLELVFPVEVISVKGEKVYLNRGKDGGLKTGDVLDIYLKGEALIDPHTGEQLGSAEEFVGKVKVTKVNPKFTIATILQDKLEGEISVGCIVRKP